MESDMKLSTNNSPPAVGFAKNGYITCFFSVYSVPRIKTRKVAKTTLIERVTTGDEYVILHSQGTNHKRKAKETFGEVILRSKNCALLEYYAASSGTPLQTPWILSCILDPLRWDRQVVPKRR
jgi:hypothetical protein